MQAPKSQGGNYEPAPAGNHVAILYRIINIGTVEEPYMGAIKEMNKIMLTFELCNEKKEFKEGEGERPISISREYTFSMGEKANLRKFVEGYLGVALQEGEAESFDIETLVGKPCLLNVIHKISKTTGKDYALVQGASPLPKGMTAPAQVNPSLVFGHGDNWNQEVFEGLNKFIKEKIMSSNEYKTRMKLTDARENGIESVEAPAIGVDDIPF